MPSKVVAKDKAGNTSTKELEKISQINFEYVGQAQSITLPTGKYKLEVWGAQGGYGKKDGTIKGLGGKGGYSIGYIDLQKHSVIWDQDDLAKKYTEIFRQMESECSKCMNLRTCKVCLFQKRMKCKAVTLDEYVKEIISNMDLLREREEFVKYS